MSSRKKFKFPAPRSFLKILALCLACSVHGVVFAQRDSIPEGYPQSLQQEIPRLLAAKRGSGSDVMIYLQLAEAYLNMGDDLFSELEEKIAVFEQGRVSAQEAIKLDADNAEAYFLYAANLGNKTKLKGRAYGALTLNEILDHVKKALQLDPNHAPALQMMGGLLAELPWFLGGDIDEAQKLLERAIEVDGNYTNARIILAELFIKQGKLHSARRQLMAVIQAERPHYPYTWNKKFLPKAQQLLQVLPD